MIKKPAKSNLIITIPSLNIVPVMGLLKLQEKLFILLYLAQRKNLKRKRRRMGKGIQRISLILLLDWEEREAKGKLCQQ